MPYSVLISRADPSAILFVVDQSASMNDAYVGGTSKAQYLADALNRLLYQLLVRCTLGQDGVRDYLHIGVIGYSGKGVETALTGLPDDKILHPISMLERHPKRVEVRTKKVPDGAGGLVEQDAKFPVWVDPVGYGGTPMAEAFTLAGKTLIEWCSKHPKSYPPTMIHISDGEISDHTPVEKARVISSIKTSDGNCLIFNLHLSSNASDRVIRHSPSGLPLDFKIA